MLKPSLAQDAPACADAANVEEFITRETEALQLELFGSIYALDWNTAWNWAASQLPDLLVYAAEWDADAAAQRAAVAHLITAQQAAGAINCYAEAHGWPDRISADDMLAAGSAAPVYKAETAYHFWLVGYDEETGGARVVEIENMLPLYDMDGRYYQSPAPADVEEAHHDNR